MFSNESHVIRKEQCPKCRELGNDRSGDNLAVYSDGHTFCFACGHGNRRTGINRTTKPNETAVVLPRDITTELPTAAKDWLKQYGITRLETTKHHLMWSEHWSRLIFPYFDSTGLLAWQGRYIGPEKTAAKWFSQGKIHEIIHPINIIAESAVLVEDIVSAIVVSRHCGVIPIFGSSISNRQFIRYKNLVSNITIWLDPDMRGKSVKLANQARLLGLEANVIFSDKDPKEHTNEEVHDILTARR